MTVAINVDLVTKLVSLKFVTNSRQASNLTNILYFY